MITRRAHRRTLLKIGADPGMVATVRQEKSI
jgi:hypothetical protein